MTTLPRRALGRTGLEVTSLSYGAMELRGTPAGPEVSDEQAARVLNATLDAGINFIDTAPDYGRSEERIGASISHRRAEYFLASKCGCVPGTGMGSEHLHTAENIRAGVEQACAACGPITWTSSSSTAASLHGNSRSTAHCRNSNGCSKRAQCASSASPGRCQI